MRRRTIIAIIVTVITVICTNKLWLVYSPMPVEMDIKGSGNCNIEVQLNKKDNNKFEKIKAQEKLNKIIKQINNF